MKQERNVSELFALGPYLWRAQLGRDWRSICEDGQHIHDEPVPHRPERMKPYADRATEGRANPKGIPCLYVATERDTALAEVRPWIGSEISVGQFITRRDLKVINCAIDSSVDSIYFFEEPSEDEREQAVWGEINRAFSKPVALSDDTADYVPTQILAELFKMNGLDGIIYRSSLGSGHNIALFHLNAAELVNCNLFCLRAIKFEFQQSGNPYFISQDNK